VTHPNGSSSSAGSDVIGDERPETRPPVIKVLIADDHPLMIAALRGMIEASEAIEVVGEAHSGPELLALVERRLPGVVLMDLRMPGVAGVECIEHIRRTWPDVKTVVLSASDDRATVDAALQAGATAYVVKSATSMDILAVIRQAANGSVFHASSYGPPQPTLRVQPGSPGLTDRELTVLAAVATGVTTAVISRDLWVSEHTVKFHLTNIYRKLGVTNRAGAVRYAVEHDLVAQQPTRT
jgi:DNA-binding NarL/FixJ family response regulator